ncbi:hypothetical protein [Deinococcus sonorensis]|uniref:Uncharacterized protein n=2 Tax=Deinococcus sonorensis TaxID=309891 RepID=A0AAU7U9E4_9DEIO
MNRNRFGCGCFGCLGSGVLILGVLLVLGYVLIYKPVQNFLAGFGTPPAQTQPQSGGATTAPAQTALTASDVQRFVRVRRDVRQAMGSSFSGVERVFTQMQQGQTPNLLTVAGVLKDASGSIGQARAAQQRALTRERLSAARYTYVRGEVNKALGVPDINFAAVAGAIQKGQLPDLNANVETASARTRGLVAPFRSELSVTAPLGLLGL